MSLKEATATSIISRRWRYLWTLTPKLDFDGSNFFEKVRSGTTSYDERWNMEEWMDHLLRLEEARYRESWNYVGWVGHVLGVHEGSTIDELRVDFYLNKSHEKHIDKWLRYALARKVQKLELKFQLCSGDEPYTFPLELLWDLRNFKDLRRISMDFVDVSGEVLEFFLCTCPLLEELSVSRSDQLSALKIIGPFPAFKRLEINCCHYLNSVEIRDASLMFLKYRGMRLHQFLLKNVPLLVEMFVGGVLTECMEDFLLMFSSYLPRLEKLTIDRMHKLSNKEAMMFYLTVKMRNLKQLTFTFRGIYKHIFGFNLMPLMILIRASPFLQSFVLVANYGRQESWDFVNSFPIKVAGSYPHLKRVEFAGYRGVSSERDIIVHLLENVVALRELVIDLRKQDSVWSTKDCNPYNQEEMHASTAHVVDQLTERVPARVNLKIL